MSATRTGGKSAAAFRTISEVSQDLEVPQHVLRFWETKFSQVRPLKRGGGRRYYRPEDVALLHRIRDLLYAEGYTIKGVQRLLREGAGAQPAPELDRLSPAQRRAIKDIHDELVELRRLLEAAAKFAVCWRRPPRAAPAGESSRVPEDRGPRRRFPGLPDRPEALSFPGVGAWRSLVAHLTGGQGVGGSNPLAPTN